MVGPQLCNQKTKAHSCGWPRAAQAGACARVLEFCSGHLSPSFMLWTVGKPEIPLMGSRGHHACGENKAVLEHLGRPLEISDSKRLRGADEETGKLSPGMGRKKKLLPHHLDCWPSVTI